MEEMKSLRKLVRLLRFIDDIGLPDQYLSLNVAIEAEETSDLEPSTWASD